MAGTGVPIGLSKLHYAILTKDDATGVAYGQPKRLYGAITASENPNPETSSLFADDGPYETATTLGQIELAVSVANVPLEDKGILLGHEIKGGVMYSKSTDQPPWVAVGYQILKSNGKYEYKWLLKGKASEATDEAETKGDSINYQAKNLTFSFVKRDYDDLWKKEGDDDDPGFAPSQAANWFIDVEGNMDKVAPTLTTNPTEGGTITASDNITITSDKELNRATITNNNVYVGTSTGTPVDGTVTLDASGKVITFIAKEGALESGTKMVLLVSQDIESISGVPITHPVVVAFTVS